MTENNNPGMFIHGNPNRTFSLLFPKGDYADVFKLEEQTVKDLELENLFEFITPVNILRMFRIDAVKEVLLKPCTNERTIGYRQEIFETLLSYPELLTAFESLLPIIDALNYYRNARYTDQNPLFKLASHIGELESYVGCMDTLKTAFAFIEQKEGEHLKSEGLQWLHDHIGKMYADETFIQLKKNLPEISAKLRDIRSVTIGVNLNDSLKPVGATIVSINNELFSEKSGHLFNKLFHRADDEYMGITPLRTSRENPTDGLESMIPPAQVQSSLLGSLFRDLSDILGKLSASLERALGRYSRVNTHLFSDLKLELVFFIYAAKFLHTLKENGMPVCKPSIAEMHKRVMEVDDNYNINLCIQMLKKNLDGGPKKNLVTNRISLGDIGRIALITGPNQGGKTVYTQAVGLTQVLFQAGMFVPGVKATISQVDGLFTHFQLEEHMANETGRFADEIKRLSVIVAAMTGDSLLLMNESFASTSYVESVFIAKDVLKIFRVMGARVVFSTHFHDLAIQVNEMNETIKGNSRLMSLVSMVGNTTTATNEVIRTFRIVPNPPIGKSYAGEIAYKYGISFDQLYESLRNRGIIKTDN